VNDGDMSDNPIQLRAGSHCCGMATASVGKDRLSVIVLPKVWNPGQTRVVVSEWEVRDARASHHFVCLYEKQRCTLAVTGERCKERLAAASELLERCREKSEELANQDVRGGKGNESEEPDVELDDEAYKLVDRTFVTKKEAHDSSTRSAGAEGRPEAVSSVLALGLLHFRSMQHRTSDRAQAINQSLLEPLVHHLFVEEVRANLHRIRRGYVPAEQHAAFIRGRVVPSSLYISLASGVPCVTCRFDEFTESTPLFTVLVTALDVVCGGTWMDRGQPRAVKTATGGENKDIAANALRLRRYLALIPSSTPSAASALAGRVRLLPTEWRWANALELARLVLRQRQNVLDSSAGSSTAEVWVFDTAKCWEGILEGALHVAAAAVHPAVQKPQGQLWNKLGPNCHPDFVLRPEGKGGPAWVIDAKYKLPDDNAANVRPTAHREDLYQAYAYSHQVPGTKKVFLVSPHGDRSRPGIGGAGAERTPDRLPVQCRGPFARGEEETVQLYVLAVPFPGEDLDLRGIAEWRAYSEGLGAALMEAFLRDETN
jgi:5-methylcytosine-specific restriction endonuclease McrBC regulatory subunit McrC